MVARGHVRNGVVVLEEGVQLPEGQQVTVLTPDAAPGNGTARGPSVLDIAPVSLGQVLHPLSGDDDVLGEMLEGRR